MVLVQEVAVESTATATVEVAVESTATATVEVVVENTATVEVVVESTATVEVVVEVAVVEVSRFNMCMHINSPLIILVAHLDLDFQAPPKAMSLLLSLCLCHNSWKLGCRVWGTVYISEELPFMSYTCITFDIARSSSCVLKKCKEKIYFTIIFVIMA